MDQDTKSGTMPDDSTCGCDCELCKQGRHHECPTGMCKWKDQDKEEDE